MLLLVLDHTLISACFTSDAQVACRAMIRHHSAPPTHVEHLFKCRLPGVSNRAATVGVGSEAAASDRYQASDFDH